MQQSVDMADVVRRSLVHWRLGTLIFVVASVGALAWARSITSVEVSEDYVTGFTRSVDADFGHQFLVRRNLEPTFAEFEIVINNGHASPLANGLEGVVAPAGCGALHLTRSRDLLRIRCRARTEKTAMARVKSVGDQVLRMHDADLAMYRKWTERLLEQVEAKSEILQGEIEAFARPTDSSTGGGNAPSPAVRMQSHYFAARARLDLVDLKARTANIRETLALWRPTTRVPGSLHVHASHLSPARIVVILVGGLVLGVFAAFFRQLGTALRGE